MVKSSQNAIEVKNVKKSFKVYYDRGTTLKDKILSRGRNRFERREVLKGISFTVKVGEAIGLIGKNGCGKSTTLKLLTKIIYPNEGSIQLNGRVSSLLELGAGFHPDMSGRENIYMNAAVFGLSRKEIDKRVDSIIQFSELEEFIDNPVRTYSSGMYMRLAFSVAINVDADILLVDEILAVGDISFQKKCFEKLEEIKSKGTTIVIVSHSLDQIEKICNRTIWIEDGLIKEDGIPADVHNHYLYNMEKERLENFQQNYYEENVVTSEKEVEQDGEVEENSCMEKDQNKEESLNIAPEMRRLQKNLLCQRNATMDSGVERNVEFLELYLTDKKGEERIVYETGEDVYIYLKYQSLVEKLRGTFCMMVYRNDGLYCYGTTSYMEKREIMELRTIGYVKIAIQDLPLLPGKYYLTFAIHDENAKDYVRLDGAVIIQILSEKGEQGVARLLTEWVLE